MRTKNIKRQLKHLRTKLTQCNNLVNKKNSSLKKVSDELKYKTILLTNKNNELEKCFHESIEKDKAMRIHDIETRMNDMNIKYMNDQLEQCYENEINPTYTRSNIDFNENDLRQTENQSEQNYYNTEQNDYEKNLNKPN
jgi:hypothetical protein